MTDLDSSQWVMLSSILSLDGCIEFYADMGVPHSNPHKLQAEIRSAILEFRSLVASGEVDTHEFKRYFVEVFGNKKEGNEFLEWGDGVYLGYHAEQPKWSAWEIALTNLIVDQSRMSRFSDSFRTWLRETIGKFLEDESLFDRLTAASRAPLSDWDIDIFSRRRFGASWESGPFYTIQWIVRIERLKSLVRLVLGSASCEEIANLNEIAREKLSQLRVWLPPEGLISMEHLI